MNRGRGADPMVTILNRKDRTSFPCDPRTLLFNIADASGDLIVIADGKRNILYVNPAVCAKTGYKEKELVGSKVGKLYRKENESRYTAKIVNILRENGCWKGDLELKKKDGSIFTTSATVTGYKDDQGRLAGTMCVAKDRTFELLAIQTSMEEESQLHQIIESMEDAVCVCDNEGKVRMVNEAHCRMLGYRKEEIIGTSPPYPWVDLASSGNYSTGYKRLEKEGTLKNFLLTWRTRENGRLNVSLAMAHLHNGSRKSLGRVCTFRDVTNVRFGEELRQTREQLQRLLFDLRQKGVRLWTLEETNLMVLKNATPAQVFRRITSSVKELVQHDLAGFYAFDPALNALVPHTLSKQTPFSKKLGNFPIPLGEGIIGNAAISGKLVWVNNAQLDPRSKYPPGMKPNKEHVIAIPLQGRRSVFGVLVVSRNRDPEFIEEEALVIKSLADAATVALENARLFQELGYNEK